jgi:hypothetical protein
VNGAPRNRVHRMIQSYFIFLTCIRPPLLWYYSPVATTLRCAAPRCAAPRRALIRVSRRSRTNRRRGRRRHQEPAPLAPSSPPRPQTLRPPRPPRRQGRQPPPPRPARRLPTTRGPQCCNSILCPYRGSPHKRQRVRGNGSIPPPAPLVLSTAGASRQRCPVAWSSPPPRAPRPPELQLLLQLRLQLLPPLLMPPLLPQSWRAPTCRPRTTDEQM